MCHPSCRPTLHLSHQATTSPGTCPIARNPGQAIQSRASHSIQGDPFVVQLVRRKGLRAGLTLGLKNRAGGAAELAEAAGVLVVGHLNVRGSTEMTRNDETTDTKAL